MELDDITTDANGKVVTVTVDASDYDRLLKDAVTLRSRVAELECVDVQDGGSTDALLNQLSPLSDAERLTCIQQRLDDLRARRAATPS